MRYPNVRYLYKYCAYNLNSLFILINRKIWFSDPESFNDPFDCKYKFKKEVDRIEFEKYGNEHDPERMRRLNSIIGKDEEEKVYNEIYNRIAQEVSKRLKEAGVFCLSNNNDNILMWSHYADGHKGFCIEFERCNDRDNELGNYDRTIPVEYIRHDYEKVTVFNKKAYDMKFYTKSVKWKYEREWRLLNDKYNETEPLPGKITAIIFGLRMCDHHKETIKKILSDLPHVNYSQAEEVPNQYRIKIVDAIQDKN
jgi:hypothetical protein